MHIPTIRTRPALAYHVLSHDVSETYSLLATRVVLALAGEVEDALRLQVFKATLHYRDERTCKGIRHNTYTSTKNVLTFMTIMPAPVTPVVSPDTDILLGQLLPHLTLSRMLA